MDEDFNIKKTLLNAKGQMTIFFATTVLVLITFIAFIINIGVFVKAKINLQNAVDAAAFAGASVQARQLSNIAYLNWEMRNVYKEWMFKTYVLGNLSLTNASTASGGTPMSFMMEPYQTGTNQVQDGYNVPSVCLDFKASGNVSVCKKALIPGLPRFNRSEVNMMDEVMDTFVDAMGSQKAKNCAERTQMNFLTNFIWAYNVPDVPDVADFTTDAPDVATGRMGAFPAAFNLALRIRNLEAQVNKKPYEEGVCLESGRGVNCSTGLGSLMGTSPSNERVVKAFESAFRNLGSRDCDADGDELKCFFTLTELPPRVPNVGDGFSLSNLLIPTNSPSLSKYYLDLKLMPVNYATFYTMLAPVSTTVGDGGGFIGAGNSSLNAESTAECVATKVGMPVPGYPLGFVKNPDVLTYYAVKGESQFVGLFNPFASNHIKLKAFAAAKPFGGRIGPMLFDVKRSPSSLYPRSPIASPGGSFAKTSPYISRLDNTLPVDRNGNPAPTNSSGQVEYQAGMPIPGNYAGASVDLGNFWLKDETSIVGGYVPGNAKEITFGIPNIPIDYPGGNPRNPAMAPNPIQVIKPVPRGGSPDSVAGLYNADLFNSMKAKLAGLGSSANISIDNIDNAILLSRAPTLYDIHNYLVPTPETVNEQVGVDSYGVITDASADNVQNHNVYDIALYAPLMSPNDPDALYRNPGDLESELTAYIKRQEQALFKYRGAMNLAARLIYQKNISSRTNADYGRAPAQLLSYFKITSTDNPYAGTAEAIYDKAPDCNSVNGRFLWFYAGETSPDLVDDSQITVDVNGAPKQHCQRKNQLQAMMRAHWTKAVGKAEALYHTERFVLPSGMRDRLFSAYRPGEMNDGNSSGTHLNFLNGETTNMLRNFYSSKFVTLKSVSDAGDAETIYGSNFAIFSEGRTTNSGGSDQTEGTFGNPIVPANFDIDLSEIQH